MSRSNTPEPSDLICGQTREEFYRWGVKRVIIVTLVWSIILPPVFLLLAVSIDPTLLPDDQCPSHDCSTDPPPSPRPEDQTVFEKIYYHLPALNTVVAVVISTGLIAGAIYALRNCFCPGADIPSAICSCSFACCLRRQNSEPGSAGSLYPPPRYSRCGSFYTAPPPYSEVTAKPDLYPLVITCGEENGKYGGNYLMVHYFRNYMIPPGTISATSTAESLNSNLCNVTCEANTIIPPPYSCMRTYETVPVLPVVTSSPMLRSMSSLTDPRSLRTIPEPRSDPNTFRENLITSPAQSLDPGYDLELELIDCEMCCDGTCKPRLGPSPPIHRSPSNHEQCPYERETYGLRNLYNYNSSGTSPGACESPPQPTSPTQISGDSTLRRTSDESHRNKTTKASKQRKSSLYMPLSSASTNTGRITKVSPGNRASSRSAPATPCAALVPNLWSFTQRVSASRHSSRSSRLEEENNPLLTNAEHKGTDDADNKF